MLNTSINHESLTNSARVVTTFGDLGIMPIMNHEALGSYPWVWRFENEFNSDRYDMPSLKYDYVDNYNTLFRFVTKLVDESVEPDPVVVRIVNKRFWDLI